MKTFKPMKAALIGSGMISSTYLENCCGRFKVLTVSGCSDLLPERSAQRAKEFELKQMTNEEILSDPEIELVINTTYPMSHYPVSKAALLAGKHVYSEKMLAVTFQQGEELVRIAQEKKLALCCAPDTFLGAALQTARQVIDGGLIGKPVAASAILARSYHHERWQTTPERRFAFCQGGGIVFDMGSYYLTALVNLLGPIRRVCGFSQIREAETRIFQHPDNPQYGKQMPVESNNNTVGILEFQNDVLCTLLTTSESGALQNSFIIYGTEGKLNLGDPNEFDSALSLQTKTGEEQIVPFTHASYDFKNCRGLGAAELAYAIRNGRQARASGATALHVLEAALGIAESAQAGNYHVMKTTCKRAEPLKAGYTEYPEGALALA